jgi:arylsulfatase A-like enzyme
LKRALLAVALVAACALHAAERPALVVVVSVDQFRYDLPERFRPYFSKGGLQRFYTSGATFPNAFYRHGITFTGPGHAAIGTGGLPSEHGIVGNTWFERDAAVDLAKWEWYFDDIVPYRPPGVKYTPFVGEGDWWWKEGGSPRYCVYDENVQPTAGTTRGMSPTSLSEDSLGDRVKARYPNARVMSVAFKDRAAILMGGRRADAVYWFDQKVGFISSTYYRYNPAVFTFNQLIDGYLPASKEWRLSPFIPPAEMPRVTFDPPEAWPLKNTKYGGTFPHAIPDVRGLTYSGLGHELLLDFALHVIATEQLGTRADAPDVLYVGVSSTDYLGHYYGPDSMEVADSTVRLDRALERFFDALEHRFGDRVVVALTADHGVQENPSIVKLRDPNADVGRVDIRTPDPKAQSIADLPPLRIEIERRLAAKLGVRFDDKGPLRDALVYFFEEPALFLNWRRVAELGLDGERVKRALRDVIVSLRSEGFANAWTNTEMITPNARASRDEQLMRASYRSDRGGDVLMALRPGWIWYWGSNSTTHGQPVDNDLHVPLMLYGAGIKPGRYETDASPVDLAPTLGTLLGVDAGGRAAHVLPCVEPRVYPSATP